MRKTHRILEQEFIALSSFQSLNARVYISEIYLLCYSKSTRVNQSNMFKWRHTVLMNIFNLGFSFAGYWQDKVDVICFLSRNYNRDSKKNLIDCCWSIVLNEQNFTKGNNSTKEIKTTSGTRTDKSSVCVLHTPFVFCVLRHVRHVHRICFQAILMTFICDLKIDLIMFIPHCVKLIFLISWLFDCLPFWHLTYYI